MSVYIFEMTGDNLQQLTLAIQYALTWHKTAKAWAITHNNTLLLLTHKLKGPNSLKCCAEFLSPHMESQLTPIIDIWLKEQEYPTEPKCDGSIKKGFKISNVSRPIEGWDSAAVIAEISPHWNLYHK